ncbi:hypothetical protein SAMN05421857_1255 [Chryseobacterium formosense]|nr:hypothetical protein SAMN05421857_1255 [Chryseobacterium formosense]
MKYQTLYIREAIMLIGKAIMNSCYGAKGKVVIICHDLIEEMIVNAKSIVTVSFLKIYYCA